MNSEYGAVAVTVFPDCSICQVAIQTQDPCLELSCGHLFHSDCIRTWFTQSVQQPPPCPLCRSVESQGPFTALLLRRQRTIPEYGLVFEFACILHIITGLFTLTIACMFLDKTGSSTVSVMALSLNGSRCAGYIAVFLSRTFRPSQYSSALRKDAAYTVHAFWTLALTPLQVVVLIQLARVAGAFPADIILLVFEAIMAFIGVCLYTTVVRRAYYIEPRRQEA